jgi:hypothetical protein
MNDLFYLGLSISISYCIFRNGNSVMHRYSSNLSPTAPRAKSFRFIHFLVVFGMFYFARRFNEFAALSLSLASRALFVFSATLLGEHAIKEAGAQTSTDKPSFGVASPQDVAGAQRKPAGPGFQEVTIIDSKGFKQPIAVGTIRIPSEWITRGGIDWDRKVQCVSNMMRFGWTASAPDGSQGFEVRPGYTWQVQGTEARFNPCSPLPVNSAREYLHMIVQQRYGGRVRVVEYRNRPDLSKAMQANASGQGKAWHEAGQIIINYSAEGREIRESIIGTIVFTELQGNIMAGAGIVYAQFAPEGKLDLELGETLRKSMQPNKEWMDLWGKVARDEGNRIAQETSNGIMRWHNDRMAEISLKGANDRSKIRMDTQREVSQIYSQTWQSTQATNDRMHRRSLEAIGEYNTYKDPNSGTPVRATIHNNHVWKVGDGRYVSTNDPNFKPTNGVELRRIP